MDCYHAREEEMNRAGHINQARVYLAQARVTPHREFRIVLQSWAAKRRLLAMQPNNKQLALF